MWHWSGGSDQNNHFTAGVLDTLQDYGEDMPEKIDHHNPAHIFIGCTDPGECVYADTTPRESDDRDLFGVLDELSDLLPGAKFNANDYAEAYMLVFKLRNMLEGRSRCTAEQVHRDLGARKSI